MTFNSRLSGVPLQADQLAAAITRMQQMQESGKEGQQKFDEGLNRQQNVAKAQDNTAARADEQKARISKAKLATAENEQALKKFMAQQQTYGDMYAEDQRLSASRAAAQNSMLAVNPISKRPLNIGSIAGGNAGVSGLLGNLLMMETAPLTNE